ncbi:hypothetical protein AVEN_149074-1 [Araneus ventricosus]|uniref:Uncharacterized protein n=1 Tax=Araneus ventricosus TaxID=182803 RepID=A0A4Y2R711_ARAVE|nr:hypothetical protein AVEN_251239-1 [Araneus ventricosus]GBN70289.1 hypothetical protein AVEN_7038-1 [Araneus ventricosus]GBN70571.1 hypothetical protein AVEN_84146-1 [Araneus ventricosus]GBN70575.1 hypothetical protein AVEN_149074-1 [Araneus ventricosus]
MAQTLAWLSPDKYSIRDLLQDPDKSSSSFIFSIKGIRGLMAPFMVTFHCFSNFPVSSKYFSASLFVAFEDISVPQTPEHPTRTKKSTESSIVRSAGVQQVVMVIFRDVLESKFNFPTQSMSQGNPSRKATRTERLFNLHCRGKGIIIAPCGNKSGVVNYSLFPNSLVSSSSFLRFRMGSMLLLIVLAP